MEAKLNEVIQCEHKCDRLKEKYIETLFKKKRALPFLIEDRYKLIQSLDSISDKSEEIAHFILLFPYDIYEDIQGDMKKLSELSHNIVYELINMVEMMENNFTQAYQKTFDIEKVKRDARDIHYDLLEKLFSDREDALRVYLTSKLIVWQFDIISNVEEISDYLRGLIIKYPNK
jgi:predicted phosphate transport protein (TIGR00153 family)